MRDERLEARLLGDWGEQVAAEYLQKKGYRLRCVGYRTRVGEIDLILEKGDLALFVEVKTRRTADFAEAKEYVTGDKQRRIVACAGLWLSRYGPGKDARFDVVEVYAPEGYRTKKPEIRHIEGAFGSEGTR